MGAFHVHDLKGMRIGAGPQGSASELATWAVINALMAMGLVPGKLQPGAGTDLILSGDLDAIHGFTGAPVSGLAHSRSGSPPACCADPGGAGSDPLPERPLLPRRHPRRHLPRAVPGCRHLWVKCLLCRASPWTRSWFLHDPGPCGSLPISWELLYPAMSVLSDRILLSGSSHPPSRRSPGASMRKSVRNSSQSDLPLDRGRGNFRGPVFYPPGPLPVPQLPQHLGREGMRLGMAISALAGSTSSTCLPHAPTPAQDRNTSRYAGTSRLDPFR